MYKVVFQIHGAADVLGKVFPSYQEACFWAESNSDNFSLYFFQEVFH